MSKKSSIFFQISVFFALVLVVINFLIYIQFSLDFNNLKALMFKRYISVVKSVEKDLNKGISKKDINEKISSFNMKYEDINIEEIIKLEPEKIDFDEEKIITLYKLGGTLYVYFNPKPILEDLPPPPKNTDFRPPFKPKEMLFIDLNSQLNHKFFWMFIFIIINLTLFWFFYFLYKKLKPLLKLKHEINKFSEGNLDIDTSMAGKDEISQVSNEFNNAIEKIRDLNSSRKLFMRNILHELKTPITKGKLVSDTLDENKKKYILQRAFLRLEYLLEEFVKLEELVSGKINLNKKEYRVVDLLDQAFDILLIDETKLKIYKNSTTVEVDYELFAISIKNLIDNALKYKSDGMPEIIIKEDSLIFKNKGKPLTKPFEQYLKPFNREYESIDKGLGLGLYITNNIIERHDFNLYYYYSEDFHIFKIQF